MKVINKEGTDKTVIMGIREILVQPFQAPEWTDLRVGWLLSITADDNDDDPTGLAEELGTPPRPLLDYTDRVLIGVTDRQTGTVFLGFTTRGNGSRHRTVGTSKLVSSDIGVGTSNDYFWRPTNEVSNNWGVQIYDQDALRALSGDGSQIHFPQDVENAGGYAVLISLRLRRDNTTTRKKIITLTTKKATAGGHSGDVVFTNAPTRDLLTTHLQSFSDTVQQLGPVELSQVPDSFFVYWPFRESRLRIHAMGIVKAG